ncbi:nuclear transport factor 2 family protein [Aliidiomarina sp. Khilg15.8]
MRLLSIALYACCLAISIPVFANDRIDRVNEFVAAFNAQDSDAMAELVADDVQWLSVDGEEILVETDGKAALTSAMENYFKTCPSCRSELVDMIVTGDQVSAIEQASWQGQDGKQSQRALSVYEFSGNLIQRVYYFQTE